MVSLTLVRSDKNYYLEFEVRDSSGKIVNISSCTIRFKMQRYGSPSLIIDKEGKVTSGSLGLCQVYIEDELLNLSGEFFAEVQITWSSGKVLTAPSINVKILKDLPRD